MCDRHGLLARFPPGFQWPAFGQARQSQTASGEQDEIDTPAVGPDPALSWQDGGEIPAPVQTAHGLLQIGSAAFYVGMLEVFQALGERFAEQIPGLAL